jgi:hypothetical protein
VVRPALEIVQRALLEFGLLPKLGNGVAESAVEGQSPFE